MNSPFLTDSPSPPTPLTARHDKNFLSMLPNRSKVLVKPNKLFSGFIKFQKSQDKTIKAKKGKATKKDLLKGGFGYMTVNDNVKIKCEEQEDN